MNNKNKFLKTAKDIKLVVFDVDGVLTDGKLFLGENGNEYKAFHVQDGLGLVLLLQNGFEVAVITARTSNIVAERMQALGIKYLYQGQNNKEAALDKLIKTLNIQKQEVAYIGDDLIDLPAMKLAGLAVAVNNAHDYVKEYADFVTEKNGGEGAAREVCELILEAAGKLETICKNYLT